MTYTIDLLREIQKFINEYGGESYPQLQGEVENKFNILLQRSDNFISLESIPNTTVEKLTHRLNTSGLTSPEYYLLGLLNGKLPPAYMCYHCNNWFKRGEEYEYRGYLFCPSCYENSFRECYECGTLIYEDDSIRDAHWDHYCLDCADEHLLYCDYCNEYHRRDNMVSDASGNYMCRDCFEYHYYICDDCGDFVYHTDAYWNDDTPYCEECHHNNSYIREYGYKPAPIFHGEGNRFLGIELEVDRGGYDHNAAREVIDILGSDYVYCKYDGSLDDGFEIVSHPATLEYHSQVDWEGALQYLRDEGYESHDAGTCGIHIHMNRAGFGITEEEQELGIAKVLYFFERFWDKVVKFSRRTQSQLDDYAARYLYKSSEHPEDILEYAKNDMSRYRCVNLCPRSTVEIRVFRGSLVYETFMASLQFCELLYDVAAMPLEAVMEITWNEFKEMGSKYKEFGNYLERRGL